METLEQKMTRVNTAVSTIKTNLHFDDNAVIEDVANATNITRLINVFVQPEEPSIKEGIWFQTDERKDVQTVAIEDSPIVPKEWRDAEKQFLSSVSVNVDSQAYTVSDHYLYTVAYSKTATPVRYDLSSNLEMTTYNGPTYSNTPYTYAVHLDGNILYAILREGWNNYVVAFDLANNSYTSYPINRVDFAYYSEYDNSFYYGGTSYPEYGYDAYRFSLDTRTENLAVDYCADSMKRLVVIGQYLVGFSAVPSRTKVRDMTHDYQTVSHGFGDYKNGSGSVSFVDFGPYVYVMQRGTTSKVDRIRKDNLTVESDVIPKGAFGQLIGGFVYNDTLYAIVSLNTSYSYPAYIMPVAFEGANYDNDRVIISQGQFTKTEKRTQLWDTLTTEGRFLYSFYDAYYYNKEEGFINDVPAYYGDGTKWIKFKN